MIILYQHSQQSYLLFSPPSLHIYFPFLKSLISFFFSPPISEIKRKQGSTKRPWEKNSQRTKHKTWCPSGVMVAPWVGNVRSTGHNRPEKSYEWALPKQQQAELEIQ